MSKALKIILGIVAIFVIFMITAVILITVFVDPNNYKDQITATVKDKTGRNLTIGGNIELSFFPWLGLELGPTELSNAPGFGKEPFVKVSNATIRVKVLPLFKGDVEMNKLILDGLALNLMKNRAGQTNWQDLARKPSSKDKPPKTAEKAPTPKESKPAPPILAGLVIGGISVRNSSIRWNDKQGGTDYSVDNLDLTIGKLKPGNPFDMKLKFDVKGQKDLKGSLRLASRVFLDAAVEHFRLDDTEVNVRLAGGGLPPKGIDGRLQLAANVDLTRQTLELSPFNLKALDLGLEGSFKARKLLTVPQVSGNVKIAQFSPRNLLEAIGQRPPSTTDPSVLEKFSLDLSLKATANSVDVEKLKAQLDDTTIEGKLGVKDFKRSAIQFVLTLNSIDLDRYMPPPGKRAEEKPKPEIKPAAAKGDSAILPIEAVALLDLDGTLLLKQLKVKNLQTKDIRVAVRGKSRLLKIEPVTAKLYGGSYKANVHVDARSNKPRLSTEQKLTGVQAGPMVRDLAGAERISGKTEFSARIGARGDTDKALRRSMTGIISFSIADGAVEGINVEHEVCKAWATFKRKPAPSGEVENKTKFASFKGTAKITNGLLRNEDLLLTSPVLQGRGKGTVNLVEDRIDYNVDAMVLNPMKCQGVTTIKELKGVTIPIHITGTLADPQYGLDIKTILSEQLKSKARKQMEKAVGDKIPEPAKKLLEGLFGK